MFQKRRRSTRYCFWFVHSDELEPHSLQSSHLKPKASPYSILSHKRRFEQDVVIRQSPVQRKQERPWFSAAFMGDKTRGIGCLAMRGLWFFFVPPIFGIGSILRGPSGPGHCCHGGGRKHRRPGIRQSHGDQGPAGEGCGKMGKTCKHRETRVKQVEEKILRLSNERSMRLASFCGNLICRDLCPPTFSLPSKASTV